METQKASFSFKEFKITKSLIEYKDEFNAKNDFGIEINPSGEYYNEEKKYILKLDITINEKSSNFKAEVSAKSIFFVSVDLNNNEIMENMLFLNAPAIHYW